MAVGRVERRAERQARVTAAFGDKTERVLDLIEILELAWHDTYGEVAPPDQVIDDLLLLSGGSVEQMIRWAREAIIDWRDIRMAADAVRSS